MIPNSVIKFFFPGVFFILCHCASFCQTPTLSSSFKIRHTSTARFFQSRKYIHTPANATIIAGKWGTTEDDADLLLMKLDETGKVLWSTKTPVDMRLDDYQLVEMSDGSILFFGNSQYNSAPMNSDMILIKFTCQGEITWSRKIAMPPSVARVTLNPYSIKEGKNNDAILSFFGYGNSVQYTVICRVNSSGTLVWSKTFYGSELREQLLSVAFYSKGKIVVFGLKRVYDSYTTYNKAFYAMKLNYDNGATEDLKGYNYSEFITNHGLLLADGKRHFYAEQLTNGDFAVFGIFSNFDKQNFYYFKLLLKEDLSIYKSNAFSTPGKLAGSWSKISVFPNGQTHIVSWVNDDKRFYWYAVDSLQNKIREQTIDYSDKYVELRYAANQSGSNRSMYVLSTIMETASLNSTIEVVQLEDNESRMLPCLGTDTSFIKILPWQVSAGSMQWQSVKDNEAMITTLQFSSSGISVTSNYSCEPLQTSPVGPSQIKIAGNETVCFTTTPQEYVAHRINLSASVKWVLGPGQNGVLNTINDSTVAVTFANPGTQPKHIKLYAITRDCTVTSDSLEIAIFPPLQKLSASTGVCDLPFTLHPGSWFKSYVWQNGSTDSTFSVTAPGLYYVTITDVCGSISSDSVRVNPGTATSLDIGPDRTKCNSDTLHLSAGAGFVSYTWGNNYNINSLTSQNVVVNPLTDTMYYLKAEVRPGCFVYDTVKITVNKSPLVDLGADKNFCLGDSAQLKADGGFIAYLWNNATSEQTLVVKAKGTYSIVATTQQGCRSYDTIQVLQVYPLPIVTLSKDSVLCFGETKIFDAGVFSSYLWQDGSKSRTFAAKNIGNYSVSVYDANGCHGFDSVSISSISPQPHGFLPPDTAICVGEKLELIPLSFYKGYLWNTGATTSSILVTKPGSYWLTVQDMNNCRGTDSILVNTKDCKTGLYVPGAFTPNGDNKNDVFRPMFLGNVKQFQFTIYNRWGQVVFRASDLQSGWNGTIAGELQPAGVFVWACTYQFEGSEAKVEKGTVILVR